MNIKKTKQQLTRITWDNIGICLKIQKFYLLQDEYNNKNTLGFLSLSPYPRNTSFGPLRLWARMKPTYQQDRDMFSCFIM